MRSSSVSTKSRPIQALERAQSYLKLRTLTGHSHDYKRQLREHIDAFIEAYNENAKLFVWTKTERRVRGRRVSQS
jgi:hypothetical protein